MSIRADNGGGGGSTPASVNTDNFVPYVGATSDLNMGSQDIILANLGSGVVVGTGAELASVGTALATDYLKGDLSWGAPAGGGDVSTGIAGSTAGALTVWDGTGGATIKTTNVVGLFGIPTIAGGIASITTGQVTVVSPLAKDNATQVIGNSLAISIDTSGYFPTITTGAVTVVSPLSTDNLVYVIGDTLEVGIDTSNFFAEIATGAISATTPITVTGSRYAVGGALVVGINTANMVPYAGANSALDLGSEGLTANAITVNDYDLPLADGNTGQVVMTDGSGITYFGTVVTSNPVASGTTDHAAMENLDYASAAHTGFWATQTTGAVSGTSPVNVTASRQVLSGALAISMDTAHASGDGYLTQADWGTFNDKWAAQTTGALTGTSPISITGAREVFGGATTVTIDTSGMVSVGDAGANTMHSKSLTIDVPSESADYMIWRTPYAITVRTVAVICTGAAAANIVGFLDECDGNGMSASAMSDDVTAVSGTNMVTAIFDDATVNATDYIRWHTTSTSGTLESACVTMDYTID